LRALPVIRASPPVELWRPLLEKRLRALFFVLRSGTKREQRSFQRQALGLARFQSFVHRLERKLDGERRVGEELLQDCLGAWHQIGRWNDFVHESNALGFRCADGVPQNVKICKKGTWNDRMMVETSFSLLTVIAHAKKIHHRLEAYIEARLAYTVAMFNICLKLFHQLHPQESRFKMSIAEFSL